MVNEPQDAGQEVQEEEEEEEEENNNILCEITSGIAEKLSNPRGRMKRTNLLIVSGAKKTPTP